MFSVRRSKQNNSKRAYQLVKNITSAKQGRSTTIQDKNKRFSADRQNTAENYKTMRVMATM